MSGRGLLDREGSDQGKSPNCVCMMGPCLEEMERADSVSAQAYSAAFADRVQATLNAALHVLEELQLTNPRRPGSTNGRRSPCPLPYSSMFSAISLRRSQPLNPPNPRPTTPKTIFRENTQQNRMSSPQTTAKSQQRKQTTTTSPKKDSWHTSYAPRDILGEVELNKGSQPAPTPPTGAFLLPSIIFAQLKPVSP